MPKKVKNFYAIKKKGEDTYICCYREDIKDFMPLFINLKNAKEFLRNKDWREESVKREDLEIVKVDFTEKSWDVEKE